METIRIAATALNTHKLRSFLTLLGVIIGVMTVVYVVTQFGIITSQEEFLAAIKRKKIDFEDFDNVRQRCRTCGTVGAQQDTRAAVKRESKRLADVQIHGGTANMAEISNLDLEDGRS